ncbi:MAG TPA: GPR endopeptidase [Clostridiales bacterium]|nr:GPR endopeptidase [Clostridiales bacterium]
MQIRTDLALEQHELNPEVEGIESEEITVGKAKITRITVLNEKGEQAIGKKRGRYITVEVPPFSDDSGMDEDQITAIKNELANMIPKEGVVLVVGLGNTNITPDALGPKTASRVLATRHITQEFARSIGLEGLRGVAVISPGVLGQTGIETSEIIMGTIQRVNPSAVIVIDALASRRLARLGCTVQMADTGISPGSGVGNERAEISKDTLGVPVISIGVPTVVDATTLAYDLLGEKPQQSQLVEPRGAKMIVTPREIDILIDRAAQLLSHSINCALQPSIDPEVLLSLV